MVLPKTRDDREYNKFSDLGSNRTAIVVTNQVAGLTGYSATEKKLISVSADPTDTTVDLANGTVNQNVGKVLVSIPGATGDIVVGFYDDAAPTTLLVEYYLINMPPDGFPINKAVATGSLGVRIAGITNATKKAYLSIQYGY